MSFAMYIFIMKSETRCTGKIIFTFSLVTRVIKCVYSGTGALNVMYCVSHTQITSPCVQAAHHTVILFFSVLCAKIVDIVFSSDQSWITSWAKWATGPCGLRLFLWKKFNMQCCLAIFTWTQNKLNWGRWLLHFLPDLEATYLWKSSFNTV